ncbi:MAG: hypothetical protein LBM02_09975 [Lachnospiraceae bacterium]|jgi:hypothetical protein|nr:hypothetical protein [Lachnospiraceae bacterium]
MNNEIFMEIGILNRIMNESSKSLKFRLDNDDNFDKDTSFLDDDISVGRLLYAITKDLSKNDLLLFSDAEMLKHIQKVQIIEKDLV